MIVVRCGGEGQGSCARCNNQGKWNRTWMSLLFRISGEDGCYCTKCIKEIAEERNEEVEAYERHDMP